MIPGCSALGGSTLHYIAIVSSVICAMVTRTGGGGGGAFCNCVTPHSAGTIPLLQGWVVWCEKVLHLHLGCLFAALLIRPQVSPHLLNHLPDEALVPLGPSLHFHSHVSEWPRLIGYSRVPLAFPGRWFGDILTRFREPPILLGMLPWRLLREPPALP